MSGAAEEQRINERDLPVVDGHDFASRVLCALLDGTLLHLLLQRKRALERGREGVALEEGEGVDQGVSLSCGRPGQRQRTVLGIQIEHMANALPSAGPCSRSISKLTL